VISLTDCFDAASRRHTAATDRLCLVTTLLQQDSAPAHRAAHVQTVQLLRQDTPNFLASSLWPPNSPDLSPVNYKIWAVIQHRVCHRQIHSVDELKRRLIDMSMSMLKRTFRVQPMNWQCWFCPYLLHSMWLIRSLHVWLRNHARNVGQYILVHFTR